MLRVRLDTRGDESSQNWAAVVIEPKVWIEDRMIRFEWVNNTDETLEFRTIGAVMSDAQGCIVDVIRSTFSRGAVAAPGEAIAFEKELAPYITQEMIDGAAFEIFAFRFPQPQ